MARTGPKATQTADNPLSQYLRAWLEEHDMSRARASRAWGISIGTLRNIEAGIDMSTGEPYKARLPTLRLLAAGLGAPLETLLKLQDDEETEAVPPAVADPMLAALDKMLDAKIVNLFAAHVAQSRELLGKMAGTIEDMAQEQRAVLQHAQNGLSAQQEEALKRQAATLEQERQRYLVPLQVLLGSLQILLEAQKVRNEPQAGQLAVQVQELAALAEEPADAPGPDQPAPKADIV
ncbi:MAG: helix-turn-helix transcriptional regulator, partial [Chloroflexi bacterium]|nr:helix-turn-helix transcriptional regulator [Chloroflexota bacterium]